LHLKKEAVRQEVRHRLLAGMDQDELVLLAFDRDEAQSELRWEHAGEFEFQGVMYDVAETHAKGDSVYYRCWPDGEETKLNHRIAELVDHVLGHDSQRTENQKRLADYFSSLFCERISGWQPAIPPAGQQIPAESFRLLTVFHTPPVPPPRTI
jgi:hypothetical protein